MNPNSEIIESVKTRLKLSDEQVDAATFIYWLTCLAESLIAMPSAEALGRIAERGGFKNGKTIFEFMFYEMNFGSKMKVLKRNIELQELDYNRYKRLFSFLEQLNSLRNPIAHYKLSELKWKGELIEKIETREKILKEFIEMAETLPA